MKGAEFPKVILPVLLVEEAKRDDAQRKKIEAHYRTFAKELELVRKQIESKKKEIRACGVRSSPRHTWVNSPRIVSAKRTCS